MLEKELEILKQIEELYSGDITDENFLKECEGKESRLNAWKEAFKDYPLYEVKKAISYYYTNKSSNTRPNIAQIKAILSASHATLEQKEEPHVKYEPDYDVKYFHEDIESGSCHHNLYYYTQALEMIRRYEYPNVCDINHPTHAEMIMVIENICEKKLGNKHEFLSENDLISLGYKKNKKYSLDEVIKNITRRVQ